MERTETSREAVAKGGPAGRHAEGHTGGGPTVRDLVLGMSDGLTVPFALAAGVSGAIASSGVVLSAGLAEIAAGAISMGLGGYLAARTDIDHYRREERREYRETVEIPAEERAEVAGILYRYGLREPVLGQAVNAIASDQHGWVDFMMRNELGLERPDADSPARSALLVGGGYVAGGIFPLLPYALVHNVSSALLVSCLLTSIALLIFGAVKARVLGTPIFWGALQSFVTGGIAAGVAFALARFVTSYTGTGT